MFGKLLKYDFRSMWKQFAFIWPAALALALINRFTISGLDSSNVVGEIASGLAMFVYVAILVAMFIIVTIFTILRFYKGLLGDEGYLMHTLPVKTWQLIGSKLLCAVVTTTASVVVAVLSILLVVPFGLHDLQEFIHALKYLFSGWTGETVHVIIALLELVLLMLISFAAGYLQLYLAMSIGHLFNKNRVIMSVVGYIGINTALNLIGSICMVIIGTNSRPIVGFFNSLQVFTLVHSFLWGMILVELILSAVFFFGTEYILRKRLNLE